MATFFTSDTHFFHRNILKYTKRPWATVEQMNEALIKNWNSVVFPTDTIVHLGDVAMGDWTLWDGLFKRLNGHKILVVGNHDRVFAGNKASQQERFAPLYADWFDEVHPDTAFRLKDGTAVNLSHFPYDGDSHDAERHREHRLVDDGVILLHGHTHAEPQSTSESDIQKARLSKSKRGTIQVHVGTDAWNYFPVSEGQIISLIGRAQND